MDKKNVDSFMKAYVWLNERIGDKDMSDARTDSADEDIRRFCKCCLLNLNKAPFIMEENEGADSSVVFEWSIYFDEDRKMALPCIHYIMSNGIEEKMGYMHLSSPFDYDCSVFDKDLKEFMNVVITKDVQTA